MESMMRLMKRKRLLWLFIVLAILGALGIIAGFGVRALAPWPRPEPVTVSTPTPTAILVPSVLLSPQEDVQAGELIVVTGENWEPGDTVSVDLLAPSGERRFAAEATVAEDGTLLAPFFYPGELPWSEAASVSVRMLSSLTGYEATAVLTLSEAVEQPSPTATETPRPVETATSTPSLPAPTETSAPTPVIPTATPTGIPTGTPVVVPTATSTRVILAWLRMASSMRSMSGSSFITRVPRLLIWAVGSWTTDQAVASPIGCLMAPSCSRGPSWSCTGGRPAWRWTTWAMRSDCSMYRGS